MTTSSFVDPPPSAAWIHREAREGFEVCFFDRYDHGFVARGTTAAVEEGQARRTPSSAAVEAPVCWTVAYTIRLDADWRTRDATVRTRTAAGARETRLELDPGGRWRVDGAERPDLDGILDVDLESSSMTNAFPVRRLGLEVGASARTRAAWVRALDLAVEPLDQDYERLADRGDKQRFAYDSPADGFSAELVYDRFGLVLDYPRIAVRAV